MEEVKDQGESKLTSSGLPVVTEATVRAITSQFTTGGEGRSWGSHLEDVRKRLIIENPHLVKFINKQVDRYPQETRASIIEVVVGTIALLEHQANANKTELIFKGIKGTE
jgi:hypothetical protein